MGYLADKVVSASAQRIVGLDPASGAEQWRFAAGMSARTRHLPDPFARNDPPAAGPRPPGRRYMIFGRLADGFSVCGARKS